MNNGPTVTAPVGPRPGRSREVYGYGVSGRCQSGKELSV